ncbi:MAG: DUF6596 domain-containing protein [Pseudomonadota bacterium]
MNAAEQQEARWAVENAARTSYGRLIAIIAQRTHDIAGAEDALSQAFAKALETWPERGLPDNPDGWLVTTARRFAVGNARRETLLFVHEDHIRMLNEERTSAYGAPETDPRLSLMFACSHPSIDTKVRAPLILQVVLGIDAKRMAPVFLISPNTLGQRLARAKTKIRDASLPFDLPDQDGWRTRVDGLLGTIYAAYTLGWDAEFTSDNTLRALSHEALTLTGILKSLLPDDPEVLGLFSLMLFTHGRRLARRNGKTGAFVPLSEQNAALWNEAMIAQAEVLLRRAGTLNAPGRFQLEAAIQAVHANRRRTGRTDWAQIRSFHEILHDDLPTIGSTVALASSMMHDGDPEGALRHLDAIADNGGIGSYQPYWATRAHIIEAIGEQPATDLWQRAAALSNDPALRAYLLAKVK